MCSGCRWVLIQILCVIFATVLVCSSMLGCGEIISENYVSSGKPIALKGTTIDEVQAEAAEYARDWKDEVDLQYIHVYLDNQCSVYRLTFDYITDYNHERYGYLDIDCYLENGWRIDSASCVYEGIDLSDQSYGSTTDVFIMQKIEIVQEYLKDMTETMAFASVSLFSTDTLYIRLVYKNGSSDTAYYRLDMVQKKLIPMDMNAE